MRVSIIERYRRLKSGETMLRAQRGEAPSASRGAAIWSNGLGRWLHAMSRSEVNAILLALYCPNVVDVKCNGGIDPQPSPHPLYDPRVASRATYPWFRGSVEVAQRVGMRHPRMLLRNKTGPEANEWLPTPLTFDLLLTVDDGQVAPYCVNWNVKKRAGGHSTPFAQVHSRRAAERAVKRLQLEIEYFQDVGIRTELIAGDDIDRELAANLRQLHNWTVCAPQMPALAVKLLESQLLHGLERRVPPLTIIRKAQAASGYSYEDCRRVLMQAIWKRILRVDLFSPILPDRPLRPETLDVCERYGAWFRR